MLLLFQWTCNEGPEGRKRGQTFSVNTVEPRWLLIECLDSVGGCLTRVGGSASHVGDKEDDSEHDAEGADDDVADGKEVVGAAKDVRSGEHEVLAAIERAHVVLVIDYDRVGTRGQILLDLPVKFAEVGQTSCPHPDDEMFFNKNER